MEEIGASDNFSRMRDWFLQWDQYFMGVALITAQRSKNPNKQIGSCLVNEDKRIIGTGYNGMPNKCKDADMPWGNDSQADLRNQELYECHSEMNAVLNRISSDAKGSTLYVTSFPCNQCAKIIIQAGIHKIVYYGDENQDKLEIRASKLLLEKANIQTVQYTKSDIILQIGNIRGTL